MRTALTIAGSDCSGGAGIQADLKTMTMNGVFAMSAITALTAQNTTGVTGIHEAPPAFLGQQLDMIFQDIFPDAVKIGMVSSPELIQVIVDKLRQYGAKNIVVDPVMVSTSGSALMQDAAVSALAGKLIPLADLATPNIPEAEVLSGEKIASEADMERAARAIGEKTGTSVLLKGGHNINDANDLLRQAHSKSQHPRHRLHPVQRHRRQPGQGVLHGGFHPAGQGLPLRRPGGHAGPGTGERPHEPRLCPHRRVQRGGLSP